MQRGRIGSFITRQERPMNIQDALKLLITKKDLTRSEMQDVVTLIMKGEATPAQIGGFLVALSIKGETVEEITGAALVMRHFAAEVKTNATQVNDCVGTGGDGASLFNVSTASALVAAEAGAVIAKHGNRAASGQSGSADLLEAAGVNITLSPEQVGRCIDQIGIGFMFAPTHHGATKHAIGPRREIGVRNVFNLLGPLTNPAGARNLLVGVFSLEWVLPMAQVYRELGADHVLVVCSEDHLDEISIAAKTSVAELKNGEITQYTISPSDFSLTQIANISELVIDSADKSLEIITSVLGGEKGPAADIVALNAGATIYAANLVDNLQAGVERAQKVLESGKALEKLHQLAAFSQTFSKTR